ncbi:MAG: alpha/beta hydrolase [Bacteroidota bacterium]
MQQSPREGNSVERPSLFWFFTEGGRALAEYGFSVPYRTFRASSNKGDQHPVLVLPGFMASDTSTAPLRRFLDQSGYTSYGWELGRNTAKLAFIELLEKQLEALYEKHQEKISLIGWSLGGIYARQIAKSKPHLVRQIVTLGSPFKGVREPNNVAWIYDLITPKKQASEIGAALSEDIPLPAPVPTTAIYTKEDGIVPWQLCLEDEDQLHQNVQVRGSHFGLGVNPAVLEIIADRLQYTQANWVHFREPNFIKDFLFYPSL